MSTSPTLGQTLSIKVLDFTTIGSFNGEAAWFYDGVHIMRRNANRMIVAAKAKAASSSSRRGPPRRLDRRPAVIFRGRSAAPAASSMRCSRMMSRASMVSRASGAAAAAPNSPATDGARHREHEDGRDRQTQRPADEERADVRAGEERDDDGDEHGDRRPHAEVAERQQHGEHAGHEPADVRDVVADEDRHGDERPGALAGDSRAVAPTMTASMAPIAERPAT